MRWFLIILIGVLLVSCAPEVVEESLEVINDSVEEIEVIVIENTTENVTEITNVTETVVEEIIKPEVELGPIIVNGKTTEERVQDAYDDLHKTGSAQNIRDNFPDIEVVYTDNPINSYYPPEILPFRYYYSKEADLTFNLCNIERTVFICEGKQEAFVDDDKLNSGECIVTPIYQQK